MRLSAFGPLMAVMALIGAACSGGSPNETLASSSDPPTTAAGTAPDTVPTSTAPSRASTEDEIPTVPPDVDLAIHSVPLGEIYFDTFDGGSVRLSESTQSLRRRLLDAIPPIDRPVYGERSEGEWLDGSDPVLGFVAGGRAYAFPFKILNFHEIVNDELAGVPVLISYCPLCGSAIVYDRRVNGEVLSFGNTSALYESDLVMVDRNTGSYWWQVAGSAIVGALTGEQLEPLPSSVATWEDWTTEHPETVVLTRDTGFSRPYERDAFANYADFLDSGRFAFPVGEEARDPRLLPSALVVGVSLGGSTRAYPVDGLAGPVNDEVGGEPIVVFPTDEGAGVYGATVDGRRLEFELTGTTIVDTQTGSTWDAAGRAVAGALQGTSLDAVPSRTTFWFAFVGAFPDVEIYAG